MLVPGSHQEDDGPGQAGRVEGELLLLDLTDEPVVGGQGGAVVLHLVTPERTGPHPVRFAPGHAQLVPPGAHQLGFAGGGGESQHVSDGGPGILPLLSLLHHPHGGAGRALARQSVDQAGVETTVSRGTFCSGNTSKYRRPPQ